MLIALAREHRRVVSYDEMPLILRQAILAAEDKNFFSHSGVDYRVLPRVVLKVVRSFFRRMGQRRRPHCGRWFPQGGSTLTQQLVRGYFLQDQTSHENRDVLFHDVPRRCGFSRRRSVFRLRTSSFARSRRCA